MAPSSTAKKGPSVLARQDSIVRPGPQRRQPSRIITVDSVLQYTSDTPSMQQRQPPRPRAFRTGSGKPLDPRLTGRYLGPHIPSRSTKTSEKLVLLPEADEEEDEKGDFGLDSDKGPPRDDEDVRRPGKEGVKSYAERLPKARRTEKELPRVTAYCTAQSYKLQSTATFVRQRHGARTKLYDDCLYCAYHLPLLPGNEGYRLRSSPPVQSTKGGTLLDEAIERSEQRDYRETYYAEEEEEHSVRGSYPAEDGFDSNRNSAEVDPPRLNGQRRDSNHSQRSVSPGPAGVPVDAYRFAEMFVFSYGVVVFWNFTERQEKDVLADFAFATISDPVTNNVTPLSLTVVPLDEEDFETEEFHFEYNNEISRPRLYNDMITLRSGDHMIKLAISHAIAQSTKLGFFEETMASQMEEAKDVPGRLAKTGELGLKREEVIKLLGGLFKSRVEVNLSSNVLDVPNLIWDSEPTLHPLYNAVREYLEIKPRIQMLNERCRVFLDLAEVLSDYISDDKMSRITWIIIVLICISILVTCSEVFLRFGMLSTHGPKAGSKALQGLSLSTEL
ncbi:Sad1-interacting factor 3 [Elasticomyces elasticus]|uniref:Sad1-interacting factor 3 n=1 Tax=Exophiala sideris TaxID=1016849 RepID=A0A0D1VYP0_9EURO|nr:Sad1-interacting factor 3 [Elasticomyces elasticus]KAK5023038.1 Sad1-interacting factor 3 [Exophiala sideris]KAK5178201.1 Sad1-interacting factor 3 [Eurotiomycetes sp. CCFEE 6388]KAK5026763.1 Sad1-interacting factor 3 [Exophiala sideris]KAK5052416.1 Sad1-interacting factor 3 [Exophiala sideris]